MDEHETARRIALQVFIERGEETAIGSVLDEGEMGRHRLLAGAHRNEAQRARPVSVDRSLMEKVAERRIFEEAVIPFAAAYPVERAQRLEQARDLLFAPGLDEADGADLLRELALAALGVAPQLHVERFPMLLPIGRQPRERHVLEERG